MAKGQQEKNDRKSLRRRAERKHRPEEELVAERTRELRELVCRLVDAQEKERTAIGSELHDEIGQYLTYAAFLIDKMGRQPDQQTVAEAKSTIQNAISKIRRLSSTLSPPPLRSAGLVWSLASLVEDYRNHTTIKIDFDCTDELNEIPEDVALASYRVVQGALINVASYAKASEVKVRLSREPERLHLEILDNGSSPDPDSAEKSVELTGMRERAMALGGELSVESNAGQGKRIIADFPLS